MKKSYKLIIGAVLVLCAVVAYISFSHTSHFVYNNDTASGNTAGNLNNGGLFCEADGKLYFANPCDGNALYVMNSDCTDAKKLSDDSVASINVCGNYIYYAKSSYASNATGLDTRMLTGVYQTSLDGKKTVNLYKDQTGILSLCGNYIYYQRSDGKNLASLYKVKIDGKETIKVADSGYNPASMKSNKFYFADGTNKNVISCLDTSNNAVSTFYDTNAYLVDAENNYLYYIDISKNYAFVRLNMSTKTIEQLYSSTNKVVSFNLYGNKIFFKLDGDSMGLYRMNADGTQIESVAQGNVTNISCTSKYTFFQLTENRGILYRVPTSTPINSAEQITIK